MQAVNPVVLGLVRAEQTGLHRSGACSVTEAWQRVMPLLIHGDAAIAGLGIVQESLQLADLPGFTVGGSVHVIINNQVCLWAGVRRVGLPVLGGACLRRFHAAAAAAAARACPAPPAHRLASRPCRATAAAARIHPT
jgi:hypothetical protein